MFYFWFLAIQYSAFTLDVMKKARPWLIIAHPGHELRVFHWLELNRPHVVILTDGSGDTGLSRLDSSRRLIEAAGATLEENLGNVEDDDVYRWILEKQTEHLLDFADFLVDAWAIQPPSMVAGDSIEGCETTHDLCRYVINAACEIHFRRTGSKFPNLDFPLLGQPNTSKSLAPDDVRLVLDEAAFERKLAAARGYHELQAEVEYALSTFGPAAFTLETLRSVDLHDGLAGLNPEPPSYEVAGEKRVKEGRYQNVIRYRQHVLPVVNEMRERLGLSQDLLQK